MSLPEFQPGDLLFHKRIIDTSYALVVGNYDHEVPSKMPPRYERRIALVLIQDKTFIFESLKEKDARMNWQILFRQGIES